MTISLPQNDPDPAGRRRELEERRGQYFFNYGYIPGYPFLDHLPAREKFSACYWVNRFLSRTVLPFNVVLGQLRTALFNPIKRLDVFGNLFTSHLAWAHPVMAPVAVVMRHMHQQHQYLAITECQPAG